VKRHLSVWLLVRCLWGDKSHLWSLYVVSRSFFGVPVFCIHGLDVAQTILPHCRGTSGCLLGWIWKCTLVRALRLCTGRTAHRGSRGIALLFYDHGTRRGWGVSVTPRPLFTLGEEPVLMERQYGCSLFRPPPLIYLPGKSRGLVFNVLRGWLLFLVPGRFFLG